MHTKLVMMNHDHRFPKWIRSIQCLGRLKIGLLGGSFDPPHQGHVKISLEALKRLDLHEVWWVVTPQNPLKNHQAASIDDRLSWCQSITKHHSNIRVVSFEADLNLRYSVDTIHWLKRHIPRAHFVLLLGSDNWVQLHQWKEWQKLVSMVHIAVFDRAPWHIQAGFSRAAQRFKNLRYASALSMMNSRKPGWVMIHQPITHEQSSILRRNNDQ